MATQAAPPAKRRRRLLLWILIGLPLLVLLAAALVLPALLDVENYRAQIENGLRDATGWEAELGTIDFSIRHGMALTVSPAALSAPGDSSSVKIDRIDVRAELWPLLRGALHVKSVVLNGPEIRLVRHDERRGWVLPELAAGGSEPNDSAAAEVSPVSPAPAGEKVPETDSSSGESSFEVAVDSVSVTRGRVLLEDRATDPPLLVELREVEALIRPSAATIEGGAVLGDNDARLKWHGRLQEQLTVELIDLRTEALARFIGDSLVHPGGRLSGQIEIGVPLSIAGRVTGEGLTLLDGVEPFEESTLEFLLTTGEGQWRLERMQLDADAVRVTGSGSLVPEVALELELPQTPLGALLDASESVLPLPLQVEPPGQVEARFLVDQPEGGELTYEAHGSLTAAAFHPGEQLPTARDIHAEFDLDREGRLEIRLLDGRVADGPLRGTAHLDSVNPPGTLVFDGGLQDAVLGQLLRGFVGGSAGQVTGPTGFHANMGLDLARSELDARALSGRLDFKSSDISMPGWELDRAIRDKLDQKLGRLAALVDRDRPAEGGEATDVVRELLQSMEATVDFDQWPWGLQNVSLAAQGLDVRGTGSFDPNAGTVDLRFDGTFDRDRTAKLVEKYSNLRYIVDEKGELVVPLSVQGAMLSPSIHVELDDLLDRVADDRKEEVKDKLIRGLVDRLKRD